MAHEWSYIKSSIKHQPQKTKGFHALKVPDQLAQPLELKNNSAALSLTIEFRIVHEKVSLTCSLSSFHAADLIRIQLFSNIITGI